MRLVIVASLLLAGCPSPGLVRGVTGISSQQGYTLNTLQLCQHAAAATQVADRALPLALAALKEAGYTRSEAVVDGRKLSVCLVQNPEPCKAFGWTAGPCSPGLGTCARKAGCATAWTAWAALCWPPRCTPRWPNEPHCTVPGGTSTGWEGRLVHELFNLARARWTRGTVAAENDYSKLPALFGPGGVESKVLKAYGVQKLAIDTGCD